MPVQLPAPLNARRQCGLSLVELMVSLVLGLVLVGGVLTLYVSSHQNVRAHEGLARLQENARLALELMARDIRTAGLAPCGSPLTANVLVATAASASTHPTPWWARTHAGFLRGGEDSDQGVVPAGSSVPRASGTDSLVVLRASDDEGLHARVLSHDEPAREFHVAASLPVAAPASGPASAATTARIGARQAALACDGSSSALFQVDTVQASAGSLTYAASPLNCSPSLGSVDAQCGSAAAKIFPAGTLLVPWDPVFWYVGDQGGGLRALYQITPNPPGSPQTVERVPGVHDLQIEYLTRNRTLGGSLAAGWVDASAFSGLWTDPAREVVAVRLTLTLQTASGGSGTAVTRTFRSVVALRGVEP